MFGKKKKGIKVRFKKELRGIDFINSRPETKGERRKLIADIRMMAVAMEYPKMIYEELISLPVDEFMRYYLEYRQSYKNMEKRVRAIQKPEPNSGYQFVDENEVMNKKKEDYLENLEFVQFEKE